MYNCPNSSMCPYGSAFEPHLCVYDIDDGGSFNCPILAFNSMPDVKKYVDGSQPHIINLDREEE